VLGIADQKPSTFDDARFQALHLHNARLTIPWDVLQDHQTLPIVDEWMAKAKRDFVAPLVTIDRSRRPGHTTINPGPATLAKQVRAWRLRWPGQIRKISTWNEGNINKRPDLVAKWWLAVRKACPGCTVLGADLVDASNAASWARRFIKAAKRAPAIWGLHAYNDANTFRTTSIRAFLKKVKGKVWLTETGGVVARKCPRFAFSGKGVTHAAKATDFLLRRIAPVSTRIQRIYLYSWSSGSGDLTWDSGLIGPSDNARPALDVVRKWLGLPAAPAEDLTTRSAVPDTAVLGGPGSTVCQKPLAVRKAKAKKRR
jgi:hypothetical protein